MSYKLISTPSEMQTSVEETQPAVKARSPALNLLEGQAHQLATSGTAVGSSLAGLPGDLLSLADRFVAGPLSEKITGAKAKPYEETFIGKTFPTSEQIKNSIQESIPYTKPRNKLEEFTNDVASTAAILLTPGGQAKIGRFLKTNKTTRAFFKSLGSHAFGEGIKNLTGSEEKGNYATMGSLLLMSLLDRNGASRYIGKLYNNAKSALTQAGNPRVNAKPLVSKLQSLRNDLTQGTLAPSEKAVVEQIDKVLSHVQDGTIGVENLWGSSRSLNEIKQEVIRSAKSQTGGSRAKKFFGKIINHINSELNKYAEQNPKFGEPFKAAQEGFSTIAKSNFISNAVKRLSGIEVRNPGLLHLFGSAGGAAGGTMAATKAAAGTGFFSAGAVAGYQAIKMLYRVMKSPTLRKYYFQGLKEASKGNVTQFANKVNRMDKIIEKEDKVKKPYKIVKKD
ncbi:MAG: hypothetical protein R6U52_01545 [Kosmotogaceae bacterium]